MVQPLFVELLGLPGVGKTTVASLLQAKFAQYNLKCAILQEAAIKVPSQIIKGTLSFTLWTLNYCLSEIIDYRKSREFNIVILDRGLLDTICWVRWLKNIGLIKGAEERVIEKYIEKIQWFETTPLIIVLHTDFTTTLKRRRGEIGRIVNEKTYLEIKIAYEQVLSQHYPRFLKRQVKVLDTTDISPSEVCDWAFEQIIKLWPSLLAQTSATSS